jgi:3(or 17)beta-hydroxysteroid dehydrogenase
MLHLIFHPYQRDTMSSTGAERVKGKIALITGAASGIGFATSQMMASQGGLVILTDVDKSAGEKAAETIKNLGGTANFHTHDVTSEENWVSTIKFVENLYGKIDILVNNAGIGTAGSIEETTLQQWREIHAVNSEGPFLGCKYGLQLMKKNQSGGSIINVSSVAGIIGAPNLAAYCSSKASVRLLTKSVALHCAKKGYGIRCNSVHPSYTDTPMVDGMVKSHKAPDRYRSALINASPMGRLGDVNDIAAAILYLACDDSKFTTGSELVIDGGLTAT